MVQQGAGRTAQRVADDHHPFGFLEGEVERRQQVGNSLRMLVQLLGEEA
jgi:hypothetical protein